MKEFTYVIKKKLINLTRMIILIVSTCQCK